MKILHTADCHVGCRQYGMQDREEDFYTSLKQIAVTAIRNSVNVVLLAGDVFDSAKPPAKAVLEVKEFVDTLQREGIDVVGIEGNHDLTKENYWLRVCGITPLDQGFETSFTGIRIMGINFCRGEELLHKLADLASECEAKGTKWPVVVLHCGVSEMGCAFNPDVTLPQLAPLLKSIGCTYCALGHIHISMEQKHEGIVFVQPGSIELKSIDEPKDKSVELVEMEENTGKIVSLSKIPLSTRKTIVLNVETEEDLTKLASANVPGALVVCYVSNDVHDGVSKVSDTLKNFGVLYRVVPVGDKTSVVTCDRHDSMNLLQDAVTTFFDASSVEYRLVMDILNTSNPRLVLEDYLNGRYDGLDNLDNEPKKN